MPVGGLWHAWFLMDFSFFSSTSLLTVILMRVSGVICLTGSLEVFVFALVTGSEIRNVQFLNFNFMPRLHL